MDIGKFEIQESRPGDAVRTLLHLHVLQTQGQEDKQSESIASTLDIIGQVYNDNDEYDTKRTTNYACSDGFQLHQL